ncbi:MAG: DUF3006 domain-containing protein [Syntrophothermus sp.]|uniref:DUF3006 domain-containing protein n=1 Tax=Syntrophothermus sp. TaxID=2736299 RepID=UPI00257DE8CE|nr:DUF3006 domain-containing protein [Syntrophothermus sp.]NSW81953.1 DUF3006 domain-containing protein [Syntrophothermus sp.]
MLIVDRIEDDWAVLELDGTVFNVPRRLLPAGAKEGQVLLLSITIDHEASARRLTEMQKMADSLFEKGGERS